MSRKNMVSVSGGKDSTALLLLAIERGVENLEAVFADTGHEHKITYEYVEYLNDNVFPIKTIRADFSEAIERRRRRLIHIAETGEDTYKGEVKYPYTREIAAEALKYMEPTGVPFLDMCLSHSIFPSAKSKFCTKELKVFPIKELQLECLEEFSEVYSWQGVRRDESLARRDMVELEHLGGGLYNYKPILDWTADDCFAMHKKHGVKHNPLYEMGMKRVGCMPCIHAGKSELHQIGLRFPDELARVAEWEKLISKVSRTGSATFFDGKKIDPSVASALDIDMDKHGIYSVVEWARTSRGGKQFDLMAISEDGESCSSEYGLCE